MEEFSLKILSIDTASNICGVSILEDKTLIKNFDVNTGRTHSENLMPIIENALSETNTSLKDIDLIVCDKGPGSFTGIRIGVATAKAFTDALDIPCIGISSLETLAYNIKEDGIICSMIDAKNGNYYIAIYELLNSNYNCIVSPFFAKLDDSKTLDTIRNTFKDNNYPITFVGNVTKGSPLFVTFPSAIFSENNDLNSYNLGLAGFNHYCNNKFDDVLPLYLRKSQAERQFEKNEEIVKG